MTPRERWIAAVRFESVDRLLFWPKVRDSYIAYQGMPFSKMKINVQIYLFQEIWNRTQSRDLLEFFYPRLSSDLYLAAISKLITAVLAYSINQPQYLRNISKLIKAD